MVSIPKGSPEGTVGPRATAIREFREEIGEDITKMEKMEKSGNIIKHDLQIGKKKYGI